MDGIFLCLNKIDDFNILDIWTFRFESSGILEELFVKSATAYTVALSRF